VSDKTCVDFAREQSILFDRWCSSCKVGSDFATLRELLLIEQFKTCMPDCTVTYLNEQKVTTLQHAAVLADEFLLTHKQGFYKHDGSVKTYQSPTSSSWRDPSSSLRDNSKSGAQRQSSSSKGDNPDKEKTCFYCKKIGHVMKTCYALKRKQEGKMTDQKPKGVALIEKVSHFDHNVPLPEAADCFKPFIFDGYVSVTGRESDQRPVRILRDTGGSQSFILSNLLPLSDTDCDASTIVRGIGMECVPVPLHTVHVKSDLISGFFSLAVRPCFPVDGVDFIMGNDIAGGRVYPVGEVVKSPMPKTRCDEMVEGHSDVCLHLWPKFKG